MPELSVSLEDKDKVETAISEWEQALREGASVVPSTGDTVEVDSTIAAASSDALTAAKNAMKAVLLAGLRRVTSALASESVLGVVKLSSAPADPSNPTALNSGDVSSTAAPSKVPRADGSGTLDSWGVERTSRKDMVNGYAGLDGSGKVPGGRQTYGSASGTACEGNDSRLSNARAPTSHGNDHISSGTDPVPAATTSAGGLMSATDKSKHDALRGTKDRVRDVSNGSTLWSTDSAAAWSSTGMGGWMFFSHKEGAAYPRYTLWISRSMASYNSGESQYHVHGFKTDGAGTSTIVSGNVGPSATDALLFGDGVIELYIGGTGTGNSHKLGFKNLSGGYMEMFMRHFSEMAYL